MTSKNRLVKIFFFVFADLFIYFAFNPHWQMHAFSFSIFNLLNYPVVKRLNKSPLNTSPVLRTANKGERILNVQLPKDRRWWGHNKQHLLLPAHPSNYEAILMAASQLPNEFTYWLCGCCLLTVTLPSPSAHSAAAQWSPTVRSATAD